MIKVQAATSLAKKEKKGDKQVLIKKLSIG
jgi:hypothetical protein